jgi:NDP-sugar pyrophosphorylase family protein
MLKVGKKPILQTIIENFKEQGFWKFYVAVNYKSKMLQEYFFDGSELGVSITYLEEKKRLGTGGALSLIPEHPDKSMIVMNGDILTKVDFQKLLDFHHSSQAIATMCVREYDFQVPYGVVKINKDSRLQSLKEKPTHSFFVNAGVYVLMPEALNLIPEDTYFDITTLFDRFLEKKIKATAFPIREYWIDIGQMHDYEKANGEYQKHFCEIAKSYKDQQDLF